MRISKEALKSATHTIATPPTKMRKSWSALTSSMTASHVSVMPAPAADALAAYRLTRLLTEDRLTEPIRDRLPEYPFGCHWCMGVWISAGVVAARRHIPSYWGPVADALALAAIAGITTEVVGAVQEPV